MIVDRRRSTRERRNADRVTSIFAVKGKIGVDVQLCQCEDLAETGMALRRPDGHPLPEGLPVTLSFELPGRPGEMTVKGVVVSDGPAGRFRRTGVRFTNVPRTAAPKIARHCAALNQAGNDDGQGREDRRSPGWGDQPSV